MKKPWNIFLYILLGALGIWLFAALLLPVGLPFLLGFLIARFAQRLRPKSWPAAVSGIFSVSTVFVLLSVLLWLLGRTLFSEAEQLARRLPGLLEELSPSLELLYHKLLQLAGRLPDSLSAPAVQWVERLFAGSSVFLGSLSEWILSWAARLLSRIPNLILFVLTTLLSAYFFSIDRKRILELLRRHIPQGWQQKGLALLHRLRSALKGYARSQLYLSGVTFGLCALGLLLMGYSNALLLAIPIALVDALPVFGAGTVLIPWGLLSFLRGNTAEGVGLLLLYATASITRTVLEPRFLGKQIGLHPLLTLLSLYGGFRLFGFLGMLLLPIGVMLIKQLYDLSLEF
ncbi:MAG: sporulation integral membrane protein YtvI [Oscillospiraceae bacterium]|nr:sporulation integral membrane protein YtvI [Oscillospiraceae bacterium]